MGAVRKEIDSRGVATVTLARPEKHNAFDNVIVADLQRIFGELTEDTEVRVVILAAQGESFSAGADVNWMKRMASFSHKQNLRDAGALADMLRCLNHLPRPTIARVQGAAFGGAVGLVSCCDMAVGTEQASFSLSEVRLGLVPATVAPYVVAAIGQRAARRYFQTAESISAEQGLRLGLLSELVAASELDSSIENLVKKLLNNGPQAVRNAKQLVFDVSNVGVDDALAAKTSELIARIRVSPEAQQGLAAFLEKRLPDWARSHAPGRK